MVIESNKLILYNDNKVLISNYNNIVLISDEKIIIDRYCIIGSNLKIIELDNFILTIKGKIEEVYINNESI